MGLLVEDDVDGNLATMVRADLVGKGTCSVVISGAEQLLVLVKTGDANAPASVSCFLAW